MISMKMTTTKGELHEMAINAATKIRERAIDILQRVGQEAVDMARSGNLKSGKDWTDQTGNLRSSIGYVICDNGVPILQSSFDKVKAESSEGPATGLSLAINVGHETHGLALVVVAGMNYAIYVADRGYDVLSSAQIYAQMRIPQLFENWEKYDQKNR